MIRPIWNDEFQELFEIGLIKAVGKYDDEEHPKYHIPNKIRINRAKRKRLTFYFQ
jgi:hypothetical protein